MDEVDERGLAVAQRRLLAGVEDAQEGYAARGPTLLPRRARVAGPPAPPCAGGRPAYCAPAAAADEDEDDESTAVPSTSDAGGLARPPPAPAGGGSGMSWVRSAIGGAEGER